MGSSQDALLKRATNGKLLPPEIQDPIRERLRLIRLSRSRQLSDIDRDEAMVSASALTTYELHDISSMRLYHLYGLSKWLDMNFLELMSFLFDSEANSSLASQRQTNSERMVRLLSYLSEDDQRLALSLVDAVVESRGKFARANVTAHSRRVDAGVPRVQEGSEDR